MTKVLDTSWFDLKNYEELNKTSLEGWAKLLRDRWHYYDIVENYFFQNDSMNEESLAFLSTLVTCLKEGGFCLDDASKNYLYWMYYSPFDLSNMSLSSVYDLSLLDVWKMSQDNRMIRVLPDRCKMYEFSEIAYQPIGFDTHNRLARVNINLSATDEQIKRDFNHWLTHYRQAIDIKSQKKLFTQADFDYWIEYGVIPYLDLVLIAKIEGKKITQNKLARLIFPDEYGVDIVERLRKVTKPVAEGLINNETHRSLSAQFFPEKESGMKTASIHSGT